MTETKEKRRHFLWRLLRTCLVGGIGGGLGWLGYHRWRPAGMKHAPSFEALSGRFKRDEDATFPGLAVCRDRAIVDAAQPDVDPQVIDAMLNAVLTPLGGMTRFVKPGDTVLIKPNAAFSTHPRSGAVTEPRLIAAVVRAARRAGAATVWVTDNPIAAPALVFGRTGIQRAVEQAGGKVVLPYERGFRMVKIPDAAAIPAWPVFYDIFEKADSVIGISPVKDHNLCTASLTMKNWYGLLGGNRSRFHQNIHDVICDLWRLVKPLNPLLILDGTRVLMRNGPTGGSPKDVAVRNTLAAGTDPVALDAFGVSLLEKAPGDVSYLQKAQAAGFGSLDFRRHWREV